MKNTILNYLHSGELDPPSVAMFLDELYENIVNYQEYTVKSGTSEIHIEMVKDVLSKHDNPNLIYNNIYFDYLKNVKTEDKTAWILVALSSPFSIDYTYKNNTEEIRSTVNRMVDAATEKQLIRMYKAFDDEDNSYLDDTSTD